MKLGAVSILQPISTNSLAFSALKFFHCFAESCFEHDLKK